MVVFRTYSCTYKPKNCFYIKGFIIAITVWVQTRLTLSIYHHITEALFKQTEIILFINTHTTCIVIMSPLYKTIKQLLFWYLLCRKKNYWFPAIGASRLLLISSHPLTQGFPGTARVSGEACLSRLFITFSRTAENTYIASTNQMKYTFK